jgi:hypothetical protein
MIARCGFADEQALGNFFVVQSFRHERHDLPFSRCQTCNLRQLVSRAGRAGTRQPAGAEVIRCTNAFMDCASGLST